MESEAKGAAMKRWNGGLKGLAGVRE